MSRKAAFCTLVEHSDVIGRVTIGFAVIWVLLFVLNLQPPWLMSLFPQMLLGLVGWLVVYLHRVLGEIRRHTVERSTEVVIGNDAIYQAAIGIVRRSPPRSRLWATSMWLHPTLRDEAPGFRPYFQTILNRLRENRESQYLRAVTARTSQSWEVLRKQLEELLACPNAAIQFYVDNPLTLDCLIGDREALISFPDRATYPHLGIAIQIRDPEAVESLHQWYQDFIWEMPEVRKQEIRSREDLDAVEKMFV